MQTISNSKKNGRWRRTAYFRNPLKICFLKKLAAILLFGLFLFHWMGYQALYGYWIQQANTQLETRMDKAEYNEQELETIIVPLHLPYLYDQATYERTDGEINLNGITYKYVQRRVWHDSLYLQCLPNHKAMRLAAAQNNAVQIANGIPQHGTGVSKVNLSLNKQFTGDDGWSSLLPAKASCCIGSTVFVCTRSAIFQGPFSTGPEQPPEAEGLV